MSTDCIVLKPICSGPASEVPKDLELPEGGELSCDRVETVNASQDPNMDRIFNTARTGDGKTLAAFLYILYGYQEFEEKLS